MVHRALPWLSYILRRRVNAPPPPVSNRKCRCSVFNNVLLSANLALAYTKPKPNKFCPTSWKPNNAIFDGLHAWETPFALMYYANVNKVAVHISWLSYPTDYLKEPLTVTSRFDRPVTYLCNFMQHIKTCMYIMVPSAGIMPCGRGRESSPGEVMLELPSPSPSCLINLGLRVGRK